MSRALDDLCPSLRGDAMQLLARCTERKVFPYTIDTLRTIEEQARNVETGFSKTMDSDHLPDHDRPDGGRQCTQCSGLAHALDVVPVIEVDDQKIQKLEWDSVQEDGSPEPEWIVIREEAEKLGLRAGFINRSGRRWDLGHIWRKR